MCRGWCECFGGSGVNVSLTTLTPYAHITSHVVIILPKHQTTLLNFPTVRRLKIAYRISCLPKCKCPKGKYTNMQPCLR